MNDGTIYICQIVLAENGKVTYQINDRPVALSSADILRTEITMDNLKNRTVRVLFLDGTSLVGKVIDYDPELGLTFQIYLGPIVIPLAGIAKLYWPEQVQKYAGEITSANLQFVCLGSTGQMTNYGAWIGPRFAMPFRIPLIRGLYVGPGAGILFASAQPVAGDQASLGMLDFFLGYKFHGLENETSILSWLVPYVQLSGGAAITSVSRTDPTGSTIGSSSLSGAMGAELGSEINPLPWLTFRLAASLAVLFYSPTPDALVGGLLSVGFKL